MNEGLFNEYITIRLSKKSEFDVYEWYRQLLIQDEIEEAKKLYKPYKLKAVWTPELAQDLMAFHNIDAEAELTALLEFQNRTI